MLSVQYDTALVLVSILVAVLASYTALSLADRVTHSSATAARWWIAGGAIAMGVGIWSMHFIGMLAFQLPFAIGYDWPLTLFSLMLPVAVSGTALWHSSQAGLSSRKLASGAILMGSGIASMHYSGMAAMRMQPGIDYDPWLVILSVAIAMFASAAALWIAFTLRQRVPYAGLLRAAAAVVMGFAIVGMHYTGMAATHIPFGSICLAARDGINQDGLAILVITVSGAILTIALLASVFDARLASSAFGLAASQAIAEERKMLLTSERLAREQAERMNLLKDEFLATLSHELRTPLSAILGWSQILRKATKDEATLFKGLDTIERNARVQAQLVDDLLDMSRIISGKISIDAKPVNPTQFIEGAIDTIRPAALAKHITVEKKLVTDGSTVLGDANRLQQVMWNLLSNAVKFTRAGGTIQVSLQQAEHETIIEVSDTGIGIDPAFLPHVFDRFRQADASTTRDYGGLGLGLAIVKQMVELHGGWIRAESEGAGHGTTFVLGLPRQAETNALTTITVPCAALSASEQTGFKPVDLSRIVVLVVDDKPDVLDIVKYVLGACGARTLAASNAEDGLSLIREEMPDIVISDIGMPNVDGYALVNAIRNLPDSRAREVPVIALSAFARLEDKTRAIEAGFTTYLTKPIDPSDLVQKILALR